MGSRKVSDRAELLAQLSALSNGVARGHHVVMLGGRPLDVYMTYGANCKDAPSLHHMVLPGFDQLVLERDAGTAVANFKQFVRSQYGQRKLFVFVFTSEVQDTGYRRVRANFGSKLAAAYTSHAAAQGQDDVYIAVHAGDIVQEIKHEDGWALVRTAARPRCGWVPLAYLAAVPL